MPYNDKERLERESLESLVAADLSAKMKKWRQPNEPPPEKGGKWLRILLMLLIFGGAAWLLFGPLVADKKAPAPVPAPAPLPAPPASAPAPPVAQQTPPAPARSYQALALQHYRAPDFSDQIRGGSTAQNALQSARTALAAGRYTEALENLKQVTPEFRPDAEYLRGHAYLGQKRFAQAIGAFKQLKNSVRYGESAEWYLLLARLADDPAATGTVRKSLKIMANTEGHMHQQDAAALLRAMNQ
ncbi:MAG: tetratricopeptide repeat protein [Saprospiraceae bacterium]|nr:tetratricopeptide repeat protein [Saprospiraceae bacterium]